MVEAESSLYREAALSCGELAAVAKCDLSKGRERDFVRTTTVIGLLVWMDHGAFRLGMIRVRQSVDTPPFKI